MGKLFALFRLFRKGNEVANPEGWKNGQVTVNTVAAFLAALLAAANAFGYRLPVSDDAVLSIAGGLFALANVIVTIITSKRVGIAAKPLPADLPTLDPHIDERPAAAGGNRVDQHAHDYPRDTGG